MASDLKFQITLEDGVTTTAVKASASLRSMVVGLNKADAAIQSLGRAQSAALKMNEAFDAKAVSALKSRADADLKASSQLAKRAALEDAEIQKLGRMQSAALKMNEAFDKEHKGGMLDGLSEAAGPIGKIVGGLKDVAIAAGVAAVAIAGITYELLKTAAAETEFKQQSISTFAALGDGTKEAGEKTFELIEGLSKRLPQSKEKLTEWTKQIEALGTTDLSSIRTQLIAVSSEQAYFGDVGAEAFQKLQRRIGTLVEVGQGLKLPAKGLGSLAEMGLKVDDVAKELGVSAKTLGAQLKAGTANAADFGTALNNAVLKKGKDPLEVLMNQMSTVINKGIEGFKELFDTIDFKPLTDAGKAFFAIFDQGNESGKALKTGMTGSLNGIVKVFGDVTEEAEFLFLTVELWALKNKKSISTAFGVAKESANLFLMVLEDTLTVLGKIVSSAGTVANVIGGITGLSLVQKGVNAVVDTGLNALEKNSDVGTDRARLPSAAKNESGEGQSRLPSAAKNESGEGQSRLPNAPANASGGLVMQPAAGEVFASVAPGEYIIPRQQSQYGAVSAANDNSSSARGGASNGAVHVDKINVNITAPHGVTDASSLSVTGLTIALERLQLASGR